MRDARRGDGGGGARRVGRPLEFPIGTMIELPRAALCADEIGRRRLLLLRHERPHADGARPLPRRRRGPVPRRLPRGRRPRREPVPDDRRGRRRRARAARRSSAGAPSSADAQARRLRRARRRPGLDRVLPPARPRLRVLLAVPRAGCALRSGPCRARARDAGGRAVAAGVADDRLHPRAQAFATAASVYERARPAFPAAAVDWLCEHLEIGPATRVLDLAAGTGRLTRPLFPAHAADRGRRADAGDARRPASRRCPRSRCSTARPSRSRWRTRASVPWSSRRPSTGSIPSLPSQRSRACSSREEARTRLAHARYVRSAERAFRGIVERNRHGAPIHVAGDAARYFEHERRFREIAALDLRESYELDADALAALARSTSHVAALPEDAQERAIDEIRALAGPGTVQLPYVIELSAYAATTSH